MPVQTKRKCKYCGYIMEYWIPHITYCLDCHKNIQQLKGIGMKKAEINDIMKNHRERE
jgi:hypothetical protein